MEQPSFTTTEIQSQPDAWAQTLDSVKNRADDLCGFFHSGDYRAAIFTGCGSTHYLARAAAALLQDLGGIQARGLPASELWLYPRSALTKERTLLVAISRSGKTTETLRACELFIQNRGSGGVLTLSCTPGAALQTLGGLNLIFAAGQEQSIAQTRAFTTLYLVCTGLAALWSGRAGELDKLMELPGIGQRLLAACHDRACELGNRSDIDRFYYLGSGPRYGLACELSLKMKEMALAHSEPFHFMEFRHGPKSMAGEGALIIGLVSESNRAHEIAVLDDLRRLGAAVVAVGENEEEVRFDSGLPEWARNVLYLPFGQLLALERARSRGLNPDLPRNLDAVVELAGHDA